MSFLPILEIGLWNAWILTVFLLLLPLILMLVNKLTGSGDIFKKMESPALNKTESIVNIFVSYVLFYGLIIYSVFLPLQLRTAWFYVGLFLYVLGVVICTIAIVNIADTPLGELWTKGLYRYSRHPVYLGFFLILIGAGIASVSWIFLLFSIVFIFLTVILIIPEERFCLEKFGTVYREYTDRTPRWLGIPKIVKSK